MKSCRRCRFKTRSGQFLISNSAPRILITQCPLLGNHDGDNDFDDDDNNDGDNDDDDNDDKNDTMMMIHF